MTAKSNPVVADHLCVKVNSDLVPLRDWLQGREEHEIVAQWVGSDAGPQCKLDLLDKTDMVADPRYNPKAIGVPGDATYSVETPWLTQPELRKLTGALSRCGKVFRWLENTAK